MVLQKNALRDALQIIAKKEINVMFQWLRGILHC